MLRTYLTEKCGLKYPIVGAPMANVGWGRLANAVTAAGGLGMIGVGSEDAAFVEREAAVARGENGARFGIGLLGWVLKSRPDLFEAAIAARPYLVSISFGITTEQVARLHAENILVATQVNTREEAVQAAGLGVDLIVAQGTEAGGHTGKVSTLPLLQTVLEVVPNVPVLAAGGIGTARGVAAALAAGAEGVWVGTCFLACPETIFPPQAGERIIRAGETDTVLTHVFDNIRGLDWPEQNPGRALQNDFTSEWHGRESGMLDSSAAPAQFKQALTVKDYSIVNIYAGEAVGLVGQERPAAEVVRELGEGAEQLLSARYRRLFGQEQIR